MDKGISLPLLIKHIRISEDPGVTCWLLRSLRLLQKSASMKEDMSWFYSRGLRDKYTCEIEQIFHIKITKNWAITFPQRGRVVWTVFIKNNKQHKIHNWVKTFKLWCWIFSIAV